MIYKIFSRIMDDPQSGFGSRVRIPPMPNLKDKNAYKK